MLVVCRDPCSYCGSYGEKYWRELDHIVPTSRRGAIGDWTNYTAACKRCNSSKRNQSLMRFLRVRRRAHGDAFSERPSTY